VGFVLFRDIKGSKIWLSLAKKLLHLLPLASIYEACVIQWFFKIMKMPRKSCILVVVDGVLTMRAVGKGVNSMKVVEGPYVVFFHLLRMMYVKYCKDVRCRFSIRVEMEDLAI
jgi:hypothetical protein